MYRGVGCVWGVLEWEETVETQTARLTNRFPKQMEALQSSTALHLPRTNLTWWPEKDSALLSLAHMPSPRRIWHLDLRDVQPRGMEPLPNASYLTSSILEPSHLREIFIYLFMHACMHAIGHVPLPEKDTEGK